MQFVARMNQCPIAVFGSELDQGVILPDRVGCNTAPRPAGFAEIVSNDLYNCRARRHCYGQSILRHRTRASRSFKPTTFAEGLRCVGNSSRNEARSRPMKYWEIIADNLSKAGWSLGWVSAIDREWRTLWIVDAVHSC